MLNLTSIAIQKAKETLLKLGKNDGFIRLGVKGQGCSGYVYVLEIAENKTNKDQEFVFDGLKILINNKSLSFFEKTILDYEVKLLSHGFKFVNDNVEFCGCGKSFKKKSEDE